MGLKAWVEQSDVKLGGRSRTKFSRSEKAVPTTAANSVARSHRVIDEAADFGKSLGHDRSQLWTSAGVPFDRHRRYRREGSDTRIPCAKFSIFPSFPP